MLIANTPETSLTIAALYIGNNCNVKSIYEGGPVPELATHGTGVEQDFVQLSSLDVLIKSRSPHPSTIDMHTVARVQGWRLACSPCTLHGEHGDSLMRQ